MVVVNRPDDDNPRLVDIYFSNKEAKSDGGVLKSNYCSVTHHVSYTALSIIRKPHERAFVRYMINSYSKAHGRIFENSCITATEPQHLSSHGLFIGALIAGKRESR